ncbi:uncharacterized protein [Ptychodera flava]|uniref:uncharacterized protein n=1 Tax=Ptychodera flava TaxID=63121 RepID=UPI00396A69B1
MGKTKTARRLSSRTKRVPAHFDTTPAAKRSQASRKSRRRSTLNNNDGATLPENIGQLIQSQIAAAVSVTAGYAGSTAQDVICVGSGNTTSAPSSNHTIDAFTRHMTGQAINSYQEVLSPALIGTSNQLNAANHFRQHVQPTTTSRRQINDDVIETRYQTTPDPASATFHRQEVNQQAVGGASTNMAASMDNNVPSELNVITANVQPPPVQKSTPIPPSHLNLPYVDQSTLTALANPDDEIQAACTNGRPRPIQRSKSPPTRNSAVLQLESHAKAFIHNSIAGSTRKTYQVGQSNYIAFCHTHGLTPTPVTLQSATLFITDLARNGLKFTTIRVYLAAIIRLHTEMGFEDDVSNHIQLQRTMQGIHRSLGDQKRTRLPITIDILVRLKEALRAHASLCDYDKLMLWSAFTMAFFGFLRVSEFTAPGSHDFDKTWLTRHALTIHLRDLLSRAGIDNAHHFATHSFRSGAATTAADANLPAWLIKTLGRWRSDAYQVYISTPTATL